MKNKIKVHAISLFFGGLLIQFYQVFWGNNIVDLVLGFLMVVIAVANFYTLDLLNFGTILRASQKVKSAFVRNYRVFNWLILTIIFLLYFCHLGIFGMTNGNLSQLFISGFSITIIFYGLTFIVNQNIQFLKSKLF